MRFKTWSQYTIQDIPTPEMEALGILRVQPGGEELVPLNVCPDTEVGSLRAELAQARAELAQVQAELATIRALVIQVPQALVESLPKVVALLARAPEGRDDNPCTVGDSSPGGEE